MYGRPPQNAYRLANKLRQEYRDRGDDLRGIGAVSTEELMYRAQMGQDPTVNVSEEAFSDRMRQRNTVYAQHQPYTAGKAAGEREYGRTAGTTPQRPAASAAQGKKQKRKAKKKGLAGIFIFQKKSEDEVELKTGRIPFDFIQMLTVMLLMVCLVLYCTAQHYQTTNTISDLKNQLRNLEAEASELELAVEEKNDIRVIEQIATDQLGMVKEDSVQRIYISLSEGERIDIIGEEAEAGDSPMGTLLSSLFSALSGFFDNLGG